MTQSDYSELKSSVGLSIGTNPEHEQIISSLKDLFIKEINSPRRLEQITTIGDLLNVLEIRDVLSEDKVEPLTEIAQILPNNSELLRKISNYKCIHVPSQSVNYYSDDNPNIKNISTIQNATFIDNNPYTNLSERKKERINTLIKEKIGKSWKDFARYIKIRECYIDAFDSQSISLSSKASKILDFYYDEKRGIQDPQRTVFIFCDALEKARRKNLSKEIQEILTMNI